MYSLDYLNSNKSCKAKIHESIKGQGRLIPRAYSDWEISKVSKERKDPKLSGKVVKSEYTYAKVT